MSVVSLYKVVAQALSTNDSCGKRKHIFLKIPF